MPQNQPTLDLVEPRIFMREIGSEVPIISDAAELHLNDGGQVRGFCELVAHWDGRGLIGHFKGTIPAGSIAAESLRPASMNIIGSLTAATPVEGRDVAVEIQQDLFGSEDFIDVLVQPRTSKLELTTTASDSLKSVVAHLLNVPPYRGEGIYAVPYARPSASSGSSGRLRLESRSWAVTLDNLTCWIFKNFDVDDESNAVIYRAVGEVNRTGGPFITHALRLERKNGANFNRERAVRALNRVEVFLRFAFGGPGQPIHLHGVDYKGEIVWMLLDSNPVLPFSGGQRRSTCWLPSIGSAANATSGTPTVSAALSQMFGRWMDLSEQDEDFRETVRRAVDWYAASLDSFGTNRSIVLAQASLEVLASYYLRTRLRLSDDAQKSLNFADQLTVVLASLGVVIEVPSILAELKSRRVAGGPTTGPAVVVSARNSTVHPRKGRDSFSDPQLQEAQSLAIWYAEMTLFNLLEYRGEYWDRLQRKVILLT